jgi:hypothetical protein
MTTHDGPLREGIPRPGDLWRTPVGCNEIAGWVVLGVGGGECEESGDQELLVVPADGFTVVGTRDLAVRETEERSHLVLRCAWPARVRASDLWFCEASERVPARILERARAIVAGDGGEPRASPLREYRESSLVYEEWNDEVLAAAKRRLDEWTDRTCWCSSAAEKSSPPKGNLLAGPGSGTQLALAAEGNGVAGEVKALFRERLAQESEIYDLEGGGAEQPAPLQVVTSSEGALLRQQASEEREPPRAFSFDHHGNRFFLTWSLTEGGRESTPIPWDGDSIRVLVDRNPLLELRIHKP